MRNLGKIENPLARRVHYKSPTMAQWADRKGEAVASIEGTGSERVGEYGAATLASPPAGEAGRGEAEAG